MVPDMIFTTALNIANVRAGSGELISQAETICVIQTNSGRVYSGISHFDQTGIYVHAEIEAVNGMQTSGENVITGLLLIGTLSKTPILPCANCIGYILSLNMENNNAVILMQDRMLNINEAKMMAMPNGQMMNQGMNMPPPQPYGMNGMLQPQNNNVTQQSYSIQLPNDTYSGDFIKNKVKNLLDDVDAENVDPEPIEIPTSVKKGFFSTLFKH